MNLHREKKMKEKRVNLDSLIHLFFLIKTQPKGFLFISIINVQRGNFLKRKLYTYSNTDIIIIKEIPEYKLQIYE